MHPHPLCANVILKQAHLSHKSHVSLDDGNYAWDVAREWTHAAVCEYLLSLPAAQAALVTSAAAAAAASDHGAADTVLSVNE